MPDAKGANTGFETVEELGAALTQAGIKNLYPKACGLWATPGAMYDAGPLLRELLDKNEQLRATCDRLHERLLKGPSRD